MLVQKLEESEVHSTTGIVLPPKRSDVLARFRIMGKSAAASVNDLRSGDIIIAEDAMTKIDESLGILHQKYIHAIEREK